MHDMRKTGILPVFHSTVDSILSGGPNIKLLLCSNGECIYGHVSRSTNKDTGHCRAKPLVIHCASHMHVLVRKIVEKRINFASQLHLPYMSVRKIVICHEKENGKIKKTVGSVFTKKLFLILIVAKTKLCIFVFLAAELTFWCQIFWRQNWVNLLKTQALFKLFKSLKLNPR